MKNNLIIRADASSKIGTGHVMRMIALGQAWGERYRRVGVGACGCEGLTEGREDREVGKVVFVCSELPDSLEHRLKDEGFDVVRIDAEPGSEADLQQTLAILKAHTPTPPHPHTTTTCWVVTDGYQFDLAYQRGIRAAGYRLLVMDDYNHLPEYECDVLLNQNLGADEYRYSINADAKLLLGTKYTLLRREFRQAARQTPKNDTSSAKNPEPRTKNILITMGGSDEYNVTLKVIEALNQLNISDITVKILVGVANSHAETLRQAIGSSTINHQLINQTTDMPALLSWADLAITAAGSTCWEMCYFGVPMLLVVLAENQVEIAKKLEQAGCAANLGWWYALSEESIARKFEVMSMDSSLLQGMRVAERGHVDGNGGGRVFVAMEGGIP